MSTYCPHCGAGETRPTMFAQPDNDAQREYRCDDCGEYFVAAAEPVIARPVVARKVAGRKPKPGKRKLRKAKSK